MVGPRSLWLAIAGLALLSPAAWAQGAVGFQPGIGVIPDGVGLSVSPVVSHNRRYVRLGVSATFQSVVGFQAFPVAGAVAGGGFGGGGFAGGAGLPGGGFAPGQVGGFGFAGMNGPLAGPSSYEERAFGGSTLGAGGGFSSSDGFAAALAQDNRRRGVPAARATAAPQPNRPGSRTPNRSGSRGRRR